MATKPIEQQAREYVDALIYKEYGVSSKSFIEAGCRLGYDEAVKAYSDGYNACIKSMWRNVEDELPEANTVCLVFGFEDLNDGRITRYTMMAYYDGEDFTDAYNDTKYHPEKWMEIPLVVPIITRK